MSALCRHEVRLFVQLPSASDADSKLGLIMVRPRLQSVPEPLMPDPLHVSIMYTRMQKFLKVFDIQWHWTLKFSIENWHCTYLCPGEHLYHFDIVRFFLFLSYKPVRDRQTISQSIYLQNSRLPVRQESIELAALGHIHTISHNYKNK